MSFLPPKCLFRGSSSTLETSRWNLLRGQFWTGPHHLPAMRCNITSVLIRSTVAPLTTHSSHFLGFPTAASSSVIPPPSTIRFSGANNTIPSIPFSSPRKIGQTRHGLSLSTRGLTITTAFLPLTTHLARRSGCLHEFRIQFRPLPLSMKLEAEVVGPFPISHLKGHQSSSCLPVPPSVHVHSFRIS